MKLFEPFTLGSLTLMNRVVMAPLTRSRAIDNVPNELMAEYYCQRSSAGLIITEGASPSPDGLGYARIPGIFSPEQIQGWKKVTSAVHKKGGKIFLQMMHTGRVSHIFNMPVDAEVFSSSAVKLSGQVWTDKQGMQDYSAPKEMTELDIKKVISEFASGAENAIKAGFDGVELHSANGYLLEQFLNPHCNKRTDSYGSTPQGRLKFVLDVTKAVVEKIGADKVGMRISPYGVFNDMEAFDGIDEFYLNLATELSALGLVYLHVVDHSGMGAPAVSDEVKLLIRSHFKGAFILSGGYVSSEKAEADLVEAKGDLIAFGRSFISNPDLVNKLKHNLPLTPPDSNTFYTPGEKGYTDYI